MHGRTYMSVILCSCMRGSHTLTSSLCVGTTFIQLCALHPAIVGYLPAFFGSRQRMYITRNRVKVVKKWLLLKTDSRNYCCYGLWRYLMKCGIYLGFVYTTTHCSFKAYCAILVKRSNFRHQASPRVSPRESAQRRKVELWARNVR